MLRLNNNNFLLVLSVTFSSTVILGSEISPSSSNTNRNGTFMTQKSTGVYREKNDDATNKNNSSEILYRKKRWVNFLGGICMNFPLCCDIKGKDVCGFFCPVCPIKRDFYGRPITTTTPNQEGTCNLAKLAPLLGQLGGGGGNLAKLIPQAKQLGGSGCTLAKLVPILKRLGLGGGNLGGQGSGSSTGNGGGGETGGQGQGGTCNLAKLAPLLGQLGGGGGLAKLIPQAKQLGGAGCTLAKLVPILMRLGLGGGNLGALQGGQGSGSSTGNADSGMAGMMVMAALIGGQMASGAKPGSSPDSTSQATGETTSEGPDITSGSLATFIPAICARPEIIKNLIRTNPEQVRKLARQFGFGDLPENLTPESLDLTPICGKPGQKVKPGLFGLPDLFADEEVDVQGFGGDYDYGDDDDEEIDELVEKEEKSFGDDYEGDFDGDNFLDSNNEESVRRRNFNADPSSKITTRFNFNQDPEQTIYSIRNRIPKAAKSVYENNYFQSYDKLQAPAQRYKYYIKEESHDKQKSKKQTYPDVIALVDDKYIHDVMSQTPPKSTIRLVRKRVPRLLSGYNKHH